MSKNRRNFFIGEIASGIMFIIGVLYILVPNYYGLDNMAVIDTNNLFISLIIVYASIHLGLFYLLGKNPTSESFLMCIISILTGIFNVTIQEFASASIALSTSVLVFTLGITAIRIFTVDYYHDRKDAYFYVEAFLTMMFFVSGIVISISLFNDPLVQTIELGFFLMIMGIVESMKVATKCLLKAPRFLGKIKF